MCAANPNPNPNPHPHPNPNLGAEGRRAGPARVARVEVDAAAEAVEHNLAQISLDLEEGLVGDRVWCEHRLEDGRPVLGVGVGVGVGVRVGVGERGRGGARIGWG